MEEKKAIENEIKLKSVVNSHLEIINIENKEEIKAKLLFTCKLLGISIAPEKELEMTDEYYDTADDYLGNKGYSLRKRTEKSKDTCVSQYFITIKSPHPAQNTVGLARNEWEQKFNEEEANTKIADTNEIVTIIKDDFGDQLFIPGELVRKFTIINARTCIPITTNVAQYTLCMDKYHFFFPSGIYSEYQYEIEVEKQHGLIERDDMLEKLHDAIKVLLNYTDSSYSKYKTARNWKKQMDQIFTVMFDIVGYAMKPADIQRSSIQLLNKSLKQAIRTVFQTSERIVYLPTGDGMILIMDNYADKIPKLCYQVQEIVKKENESLLDDKKIEFRAGINVGNVFKYSDINDSLNYAGDGINKAVRVTDIGKAWHILATEAFFNYTRDLNTASSKDFHDIGEYQVKHGEKIKAYNIYNHEIGSGNPTKP